MSFRDGLTVASIAASLILWQPYLGLLVIIVSYFSYLRVSV